MDKATNKTQHITITGSSGMSDEEVEKLKKEAEMHAEEDLKKRELVDARSVGRCQLGHRLIVASPNARNETALGLLGPTDDPRMLGRIGPYEVIGIIGRGGMGIVFKAFDAALNRFVAVKMLLPHLASFGSARKRFSRNHRSLRTRSRRGG